MRHEVYKSIGANARIKGSITLNERVTARDLI